MLTKIAQNTKAELPCFLPTTRFRFDFHLSYHTTYGHSDPLFVNSLLIKHSRFTGTKDKAYLVSNMAVSWCSG